MAKVKMEKIFLVALLTAALSAGLLSGCGSEKASLEEDGEYEEEWDEDEEYYDLDEESDEDQGKAKYAVKQEGLSGKLHHSQAGGSAARALGDKR